MTKKLHIAPDLSLPLDFVTWTQGILATKGMGKTYLAQVEAEELLEHGQVIVVIDPTDAWYGLRSSADGTHDGYPITIFGGDHGDVKLERDAGAVIADAVIAERFSCVICTEGLSELDEVKVVRDVLERLYRKNRHPVHVFVDEADMFAPETPDNKEQVESTRALRSVVRRGRKKGLGCTMITQRPAELKKSVLAMCEMLMVLGMEHNLDIDQVERWVRTKKHPDLAREMVESLPDLPQGDAWAWARRRGIRQRFRARIKRTFDSGATPKPGQKVRAAKRLAAIDVEKLGAAIAATVQRQKDSDPSALRARIVDLEKQLAKKEPKVKIETVIEKVGPNKAVVAGLERSIKGLDKIFERSKTHGEKVLESASKIERAIGELAAVLRASAPAVITASPPAWDKIPNKISTQFRTSGSPAKPPAPAPKVARAQPPAASSDESLKPAHLRILSAIAWWESIGVREPDLGGVAFIAKTSTKSSAFDNNRARLRVAGYIDYPTTGRVRLTDLGRDIAPPPSIPPTNAALQAAVFEMVTPAVGRILRALIDIYPRDISLEDLATAAGTSVSSSAFDNNRSWLRARGLAEYPRTGFAKATPLLFPEHR